MNSRQLQYAVTLSQVLNISQAAEKLNITQPALSKQILTLEKELGVALFDRSTTPLRLTPAGESFVVSATELLFKEENLLRAMEDFKDGERGKLVIGISPFRASYFISDVINSLHKKFPRLQITLNETNSTKLQKDAIDGLADITIVNLPVDEVLLDVIPLDPEPIVLAVPERFCAELNNSLNNVIMLKDCKDIPFIVLSKSQELRKLFDNICVSESFTPNITTEVVSITTALSLVRSGIGAAVLPLKFAEESKNKDGVRFFEIKNLSSVRKPAIIIRKGQHISKYAKAAIGLIRDR